MTPPSEADIALIHTRHEAAAVHMADGWGRLTEQPGVALVTAGPGHCNALSALYVALMAESPVVLLSGHSPRSQRGKGAFQEMDQVAAAKPVTKAAWLVEDVDALDREVATALALATAPPPGPVHLSLPSDLLQTQVSTAARTAPKINIAKPAPVTSSVLMKVVQILAHASRPLIIAGPAMGRNARWKKVEQLAEVTGIPALPMESPRGANDPWLHAARECLKQADVVLLLGKKLDFSVRFGTSFSERCIFIQIDPSASCRERRESGAYGCRGRPSRRGGASDPRSAQAYLAAWRLAVGGCGGAEHDAGVVGVAATLDAAAGSPVARMRRGAAIPGSRRRAGV